MWYNDLRNLYRPATTMVVFLGESPPPDLGQGSVAFFGHNILSGHGGLWRTDRP